MDSSISDILVAKLWNLQAAAAAAAAAAVCPGVPEMNFIIPLPRSVLASTSTAASRSSIS
jgi:hypothetical protein